jgi:hypothetical protein
VNLWINTEGDCLLGQEVVHPGQDALEAARQEIAPLLARARPGDTLVMAGLGLGWHAKAARQHPASPHVVVYEPDQAHRALAAALGPELEDVSLASDQEELAEALGHRLVYGNRGRVAVYALPAYRQAYPRALEEVRGAVERGRNRAAVDWANRQAKHRQWWGNLAANLKHVLEVPDVTRLAGAYAGRPALVVGAGPSLDQSLPLLAGCRDKALVLAAGTALVSLAKVGVAPHLALILEAMDESRQLEGADLGRTILAAATSGSPAHFANWPGRLGLFHLQAWVAELAGTGLPLPTGGHVTSAAFALAVLMGCDPIILVGQDLAFSGDKTHAEGCAGQGETSTEGAVTVEGIGGQRVATSRVMLGYIIWYQEAAAYLRRGANPRRVVNATAQGARLAGFEHLSLEQALAGLPQPRPDWPSISSLLAQAPRARAAALAPRLAEERTRIVEALACLESQGPEACLALSGQGGALAAALQEVPPQPQTDEVRDTLECMLDAMCGMEEGLHA